VKRYTEHGYQVQERMKQGVRVVACENRSNEKGTDTLSLEEVSESWGDVTWREAVIVKVKKTHAFDWQGNVRCWRGYGRA
jgi:hypothetical protein